MNRKGKDNTARALAAFSVPLILSGVLQQLYSWADAFIVGHVQGEGSLAAIGATTAVVNFAVMAITGFAVGLNILFADHYGRKDYVLIRQGMKVFQMALGGVFFLLAGLGILFAEKILTLLDTPADTLREAIQYLRIVLMGTPFLAVYNVRSAALRGIGDSRAPFLSVAVSSFVNVGLDILLVAVIPLGVIGAAAATAASQAAMTVFLILWGRKKHPLLISPKGEGLPVQPVLRMGARLGLAPMLQSLITAGGNLILQNFMNGFGTHTVAAITTAYRVDSVILLPVINLTSAISTLTAQKRGAGDLPGTRRVFRVGMLMMLGVSLALTAVIVPTGGALIGLFGVEEVTREIGGRFFVRLGAFYPVFALGCGLRGYLEGMEDVVFSAGVGIFTLITRIAGSFLMKPLFGNMVIAWAEALSWTLMLAVYALRKKVDKGTGSLST